MDHRWIWEKPTWPRFRFDFEALMVHVARGHQLLGRLYQQMKSLGLTLELDAQLEALTAEAVKTSAIEGEIEDPARLRSSLAKRLGLPTAGLPAARERENGLVDMLLDATGNTEFPLTAERLFGWHHALFPHGYSGLHPLAVACWRRPERDPMRVVSGPVGRERVHYVAPPADRVAEEMASLFNWWEATRPPDGTTDFILRSGIVHYWFVAIHPFEDGNGRLARALADLALAQGEGRVKRCYSVSAAIMENREKYYAVLDRTSKGDGDLTEWLSWYLQIHARAVEGSLATMEKALWAARVWQNLGRLEINERQRKVIGKLIEKGPGGFEGGLTRRKYVALTRASEATAKRDLAELVSSGVLIPLGGGRSVSYQLNPEIGEVERG
jgi:Fic family protein